MQVGEALVRAGTITAEQLEFAVSKQSESGGEQTLDEIIVNLGMATPDDVLQGLAGQYHMEAVAMIEPSMTDSVLVEKVPVDWARKYVILPVRVRGSLRAAMADPSQIERIEELSILLDDELEGIVAPGREILKAIDRAYFDRKSTGAGGEEGAKLQVPRSPRAGTDDLLRDSDSAPVTRLVNGMILDAVRAGASDIHLESYDDRLRVRFRIDGILHEQPAPPKDLEQPLVSRIKVMSRLDIAEKRLPQDGVAKVRAGDRGEIDIRVSTVPSVAGERVVLRLLNQSSTLLPMDALGMPDHVLEPFIRAKEMANGIILVTGPTGSGKTTTLYAALSGMDTMRRNIMTIEDPVEYRMDEIGQIQVKPKIGLSFASGLRHILRQDPDVILVGEIRDEETAEIAVRAAMTGHLVLSTLHTNDAASAVTRLADMGIQPYLIAESLRAVLAQRLVRKLCPGCREESPFTEEDLKGIPAAMKERLAAGRHWRARGCETCHEGYAGRIGVYELLTIERPEQEAIRSGAGSGALQAMAVKNGASMADDAAAKVLAGVTSLDECRRVLAGSLSTDAQ